MLSGGGGGGGCKGGAISWSAEVAVVVEEVLI